MSQEFPHLFQPLKIGNMTVKNRLFMPAHGTQYAENGMIGQRHRNYYRERALGGVGMIVTEIQAVHRTSTGHRMSACYCDRPEVVEQWGALADTLHAFDTRIVAQIFHGGQHSDGGGHDIWRQVWAPSNVASVAHREMPKAMELENIKEIIAAFATSAGYAKEAGLDGVELHAAHSYLIGQFFSPLSNHRTDQYGGSLENRLRFACEVINAVRAKVGLDFVVGMRINGDELTPGGLTLEDMKEIACRLDQHGGLDYLSISGATYHSLDFVAATMGQPMGIFVPFASAIKSVVSLPVFCVNRIKHPQLAESILASGQADMVGMVRQMIADPEFANKAKEGRLDEIRHCLSCNQACQARVFQGRPIGCIINPAAGREKEFGIETLRPVSGPKQVVVVGGGPGGLEAARVAALRGCAVTLYEKSGELGGQVKTLAKGPHREEFFEVIDYLGTQVKALGVKVLFNTEATADSILSAKADSVILATGSTPVRSGLSPLYPAGPAVTGVEQDFVYTPHQVLEGANLTGNVVVWDDEGDWKATSTIEALLLKGCKVHVLTRFPFIGQDLVATKELSTYCNRVFKYDLKVYPHTFPRHIEPGSVSYVHLYSKEECVLTDISAVVLVVSGKANDSLYWQLKEKLNVVRVGDCVAPRRVAQAIFEGHQAAREI